ncbi:MAG: type II secretion system secretin GspD [Deltaproteobacteria bacterium]|nr:type II secretion system secretin GspD [Deltaproteobacteria bacterium]
MFSLIFRQDGGFIPGWPLRALAFQLMLTLPVTQSFAAGGSGHQHRPDPKVAVVALLQQPQTDQPGPAAVPAAEPRQEPKPVLLPPAGGAETITPAPTAPQSQPMARPVQGRQDKDTVVLNFSDANLRDIIRTIADITGENFIIAPGIMPKISVQTTKPILKKDVFGIFESILEVNGLAAVKTGEYYKIIQAPAAKQHGIELFSKTDTIPSGDRMMNLVVPMEFVSANDILQLLKPTVSAAGNMVNYQKANTLIITDTASNIKGYLDIIGVLDVDAFRRMNISLVQVRNVDVKTLNRELSEVLAALGYGKDATQLVVVPIERLNSLIVFTSSEALLTSAKEWIDRLDQTSSAETTSIHIYYVRNDKASTVSTLLEQLYGGKKSTPASASARSPQPAASVPAAAQVTPVRMEWASRTEAGGGGEDVKIYVYEPSNALVIQSSQRDYQNILTTLKELDRPPKQVLIDALIAEVKLDDGLKYGIQWSALSGNVNVQQNTGIFSTTVGNPKANISAPIGLAAPTGLAVVATDASRFFGAIQALSTTGNVNVLSNPHILVKNYEKASINVGSDEPVATQSTQTAVTGTSGLIQNIEYRKTGIILTVTPQITEGGMVSMTIRQEVSDKSTDRTVGNAVYPSFTKREAETSVVAKDGEPLVIGGLIQDKKDVTISGIPLLSKIPYLGALFRFTSDNVGKTELVILLTPRVISNPEQAATVSSEVKGRLEGLKELLKKSNYGK